MNENEKCILKVNLIFFTVYLVPFLVVLSCFVGMEYFLLINVSVVCSGKKLHTLGAVEFCWRTIELGLQVILGKQNRFYLFTSLTVVTFIYSPFDQDPACFKVSLVLHESSSFMSTLPASCGIFSLSLPICNPFQNW